MCGTRVLARVELSNDGTQRDDRRHAMESMGDAIFVAETATRPGTNPTARWYAQRWEEPREEMPRPASQHQMRQAVARVLFALAKALAVPEHRETVSA
jgi:hypothetical protein